MGLQISSEQIVEIVFTRNRNCRADDINVTIGGKIIKVEKTVRCSSGMWPASLCGQPPYNLLILQ